MVSLKSLTFICIYEYRINKIHLVPDYPNQNSGKNDFYLILK